MAALLFALIIIAGFSLSLAAIEHRQAKQARREAAKQAAEADHWWLSFDEAKWANQVLFDLLPDYLAKRQVASIRQRLVNLIEARRNGVLEDEEDQS